MKKIILTLVFALSCGAVFSQTARQVLDKCAATLNTKDGLKANFRMESAQWGGTSGTIEVKGRKFHATTPQATMWFDGKTQWTYMKKNDEVSVVTPSEEQLQAINPYNFINLYKKGYTYTMASSADTHNVHLTASSSSSRIKEMFILIDKATSHPKEVKILQGTKWTTFTISNLSKAKLDDAAFSFQSKDYPTAEVIDLR